MQEIHEAIECARRSSGDATLAVRADRGKLQIVRVIWPADGDVATVEPVSEWADLGATIAALRGY